MWLERKEEREKIYERRGILKEIPEKLTWDGLWDKDDPWVCGKITSLTHSDRRMEKRKVQMLGCRKWKHSHLMVSTFSESD